MEITRDTFKFNMDVQIFNLAAGLSRNHVEKPKAS